jgi:hypothetical protein
VVDQKPHVVIVFIAKLRNTVAVNVVVMKEFQGTLALI